MNQLFINRPLLKTGILGFILLPFLVLINELSPPKKLVPSGYSSSILAFEFASNNSELTEVLEPLSSTQKDDLDRLNYVDFGFMMMYGIFLFSYLSQLGLILADRWLLSARWMAPIIVISDAIENVQLLKLSANFDSSQVLGDSSFFILAIATWTKWLLLALAFGVIAYRLISRKRLKLFAWPLGIPLLLGITAFVSSSRILEDTFGISVFFAFFLLFISCFVYREQKVI